MLKSHKKLLNYGIYRRWWNHMSDFETVGDLYSSGFQNRPDYEFLALNRKCCTSWKVTKT